MSLFRRGRRKESPPIVTDETGDAAQGERSRAFGYKCAWLAVRAPDNSDVADALGLDDLTASTWSHGVGAVYAADASERPAPVFVGSPVDGWVLVPFALPLAGPEEFDLGALSSRFGEAQRFVTHRVVEVHEWERWVDGQPVRRYGWLGESGEVLYDEGEPGELEEDLLPGGADDSDDTGLLGRR